MKKMIAAAFAAVMLASLSGCGSTAAEKTAENTTYIYGQIDSVSGNDVVLLLAEYNENAATDTDSGSDDADGDSGSEKSSKRPSRSGSGEKPEGFTKPENGEMPEGFDPSQFSGEMPEGFDSSKFSGERPSKGGKGEKSDSGESDESSESGDSSESGEKKEKSSKREKPEGFTKPENGEMPEGFDPSNFSGEMPEGFTKPENGEMPEGFDPSKFGGERPEGSGSGKRSSGRKTSSKYTLTGEQEELRIPVGTTVTTSLGVETDFEVLSAGDMIKCSVEKNSDGEDVVTAVQILEN